ncbi:MAG: sigma factor-like helix-turn-helix DNA-binding protein [Patescibacteria group bacterium]
MAESNAQIKKVVSQLISVLNQRNREIISRRFGLKNGSKETLESIGASYGITRERVRQIEEASLAQIRESLQGAGASTIQSFVVLTKEILDSNNGVIHEQELFARFSGSDQNSPTNAALIFVLTLSGAFHRSLEDDNFATFWSLSKQRATEFKQQVATLVANLEKRKEMLSTGEVPESVLSYLTISKNIGKNVFGEIGLTKWAEIKPRGVRDKSYLVLKKEGKPKHFREITELINSANFGNRKAHVQTVHNELIKDSRFVLVGRGIYGLSEWGYEPGTVKQVIANLLRKEGPMSKDKIVAHVMSTRMVKPNTVVLGMQDKNLFRETDEGHIALKEA